MERVYPDTNVLFPMTFMDLVLSMAEDYHHELVWSDFLLDEWEHVIVRERHRTPVQAAAVTTAIRYAFSTGRVDPVDYEPLVAGMLGPDPADRTHGAAAIAGRVTTLLTENIRHFDVAFFADRGVRIERPEPYLLRRLDTDPDAVIDTIRRIIAAKARPAWTFQDYLARLRRVGAPTLADRLAAFIAPPT